MLQSYSSSFLLKGILKKYSLDKDKSTVYTSLVAILEIFELYIDE